MPARTYAGPIIEDIKSIDNDLEEETKIISIYIKSKSLDDRVMLILKIHINTHR